MYIFVYGCVWICFQGKHDDVELAEEEKQSYWNSNGMHFITIGAPRGERPVASIGI